MWNKNKNSFSIKTLIAFLWESYVPYTLDVAKIVRIPPEPFKRMSFEERRRMYLSRCYFAPLISQRYNKYILVHSSYFLARLFCVHLF